MDTHREGDRLLAERAAEWLYRLETANLKERAAFFRWLKESPRHVREVLIAAAWQDWLRSIDPDQLPDVRPARPSNVISIKSKLAVASPRPPAPSSADPQDISREERQLATNISPVQSGRSASKSRRTPWHPTVGTLARVLALCLFALLLAAQPADHAIETGPGQWRSRTLNDGSIIRIGPRTKMTIEFDDGHRLVHLRQGEAIFTVAKDEDRPFIVDTDTMSARAVGTKFGVARLEHHTAVTVAHGIVAVSTLASSGEHEHPPQSVHASGGLQVTVDKSSQLETRQVDVDDELAWADGHIVFKSVPIADAIAQFNRRNLLQIQMPKHPKAKTYRITGRFRIADPAFFQKYLEERLRADRRAKLRPV